jgi:hypothetical protein
MERLSERAKTMVWTGKWGENVGDLETFGGRRHKLHLFEFTLNYQLYTAEKRLLESLSGEYAVVCIISLNRPYLAWPS